MFSYETDGDLSELAECTICLHTLCDPRILICGHSFCLDCLETVSAPTCGIICPECRTKTSLTAVRLTRNLSIEAFVKELNSTNATHATFPNHVPMCRGCCERYPPQELKRCKDHDEFLCYMCAAFDHRNCAIVALDDFATMKLKERSKKIARRKRKLHALQHDHVDCMQQILDDLSKFQSDLEVQNNSLECNVFQPLIIQFSNMLTKFTEIQADFPAIAPLQCSITQLRNFEAELDALQIEYLESNPIEQKLKCINNVHGKLTETMKAAQEKIDQSFKILSDFENIIQTVQDCPKRAFILIVSAADLLGVSQRVQELDDNLRAIKNYVDTFHNLWSEYIETEPYCASTVKSMKKTETSKATKTAGHAHSVELNALAVIEGTASKVVRKKGGEIIAFVTEVVKTCKSVNEAPKIVMDALCAAKVIFPITQWMIFTYNGCSVTRCHMNGTFTNGSRFAISCHGSHSINKADVAAFLKRKITEYSHLNNPCESVCRDASQLFGEGKWSCLRGVTGSVFIECSYGKHHIINITDRYYDYVIWANY